MRATLTVDMSRAIGMFPALQLFAQLTSDVSAEMIADMFRQGVPKEDVQFNVDTDQFAITLAGAVFATLNQNADHGCDGAVMAGDVHTA